MDFWDQHSIMFVIGVILMPRLMLIYHGVITPMEISPILGWIFVPRMFWASTLTSVYGDSNHTLIVIVWILAVVIDIIGFFTKASIGAKMMKTMSEEFG
ncbi:MAG: hypothetical protein JW740_02250 [Candidatus Zambryskibacteria bacterium]|nr:hypothetical protein [Candidatus Zambryskibacteria bacterium]